MNMLTFLHQHTLLFTLLTAVMAIVIACTVYGRYEKSRQLNRDLDQHRLEIQEQLSEKIVIGLRVIGLALDHCHFYALEHTELVEKAKELVAKARLLWDDEDAQALTLLDEARKLLIEATPGLPAHIVNAMTPPGRNQFSGRELLELADPAELELLEDFIARYPSLRLAS